MQGPSRRYFKCVGVVFWLLGRLASLKTLLGRMGSMNVVSVVAAHPPREERCMPTVHTVPAGSRDLYRGPLDSLDCGFYVENSTELGPLGGLELPLIFSSRGAFAIGRLTLGFSHSALPLQCRHSGVFQDLQRCAKASKLQWGGKSLAPWGISHIKSHFLTLCISISKNPRNLN